jgi:hypothetical protein
MTFIVCLKKLIQLTRIFEFRLSLALSGKDEDVAAFKACMEDALVVSEVFCLPSDYRKDVPPPSK